MLMVPLAALPLAIPERVPYQVQGLDHVQPPPRGMSAGDLEEESFGLEF